MGKESMGTLQLLVAVIPLAIYCLRLALWNGHRPTVKRGTADISWLAFGVSGLMVVGPLELLMPESAAFRFGPYVWLLVLALYLLLVALTVMAARPRLVIYNSRLEQIRPVLSAAVRQADAQARWVGDSAVLPELGVSFHIDASPWLRNVELLASGSQQNHQGWYRLEHVLAAALRNAAPAGSGTRRALLLTAGLLLGLAAAAWTRGDPHLSQSINELLRR